MGNRAMSAAEWGLLLALTLLWSGTFFFAKLALADLPPLTLVLGRVGIAALALHLGLRLAGRRLPRDKRLWGAFLVMGALNNFIPFSLLNWGQLHIASGLAAILNATTPLFTILLAHFLTRDERMTVNKVTGVLAGLVGVAVMIGLDALKGVSIGILGEIACIGAAISYAGAGIFGRRFRRMGLSPAVTAAGQLTASTLLMAPVALSIEHPWTLPGIGAGALAALLALALLSTALAYIVYFRILATAGATNLLLVTLLLPVGAILLGTLFLGETMAPRHFLGMGLIALGLAAIDGRPFALLRRLPAPAA
jgi:drug/metabolite transporter (DMT)-like permease